MTTTTDDTNAVVIAGIDQFVLVAEVIGTDGARAVWVQGGDDLTRWDTYGLLTEALQTEKAAHLVDRMDDQFLVLISAVRASKPRDPMRALEDALLDMRAGVGAGVR